MIHFPGPFGLLYPADSPRNTREVVEFRTAAQREPSVAAPAAPGVRSASVTTCHREHSFTLLS